MADPKLTSPEAVSDAAVREGQEYLAKQAAELAALRAEVERLRAGVKAQPASFKLTDKGGISAYGFGRFPVTLYPAGWRKMLSAEFRRDIEAFLTKNADKLAASEAAYRAAKAAAKADETPATSK